MNKIPENINADLSNTLSKAYDDLISPSAKSIGNVVSLVPRTIEVFTSPWENWVVAKETKLEDAVKEAAHINEQKGLTESEIVPPDNHIAVPALQAISYSMESEEIKSMFAHLLASATDINLKDKVHPSFIDIIKNMTPFEARVIKYLNSCVQAGCSAEIRLQLTNDPEIQKTEIFTYNNTGLTISDNFLNLPFDYDVDELNIAIDNLIRLKLVSVQEGSYINYEEEYFNLFTHPNFKKLYDLRLPDLFAINKPDKYNQITMVKTITQLTNIGKSFASICLP